MSLVLEGSLLPQQTMNFYIICIGTLLPRREHATQESFAGKC